jgi:cysteine desulfurase
MQKPIYLDYNATTPHAPEVIEAMRPFLEDEFGNPSSSHLYGNTPQKAVIHAAARLLPCSIAGRKKSSLPAAAPNPTIRP